MNFALVTLLAFTATSLAGMIAVLKNLELAPEGFQDADGFHLCQPVAQPVQAMDHQLVA